MRCPVCTKVVLEDSELLFFVAFDKRKLYVDQCTLSDQSHLLALLMLLFTLGIGEGVPG